MRELNTITELYQDYKRKCHRACLGPESFEVYSKDPNVIAYLKAKSQIIDLQLNTTNKESNK